MSVANKGEQKRISFAKSVSTNQRKVSFPHTPTDGSLKVLFYHRHRVNALLLAISFPLPTCAAVVKQVLCGSLVFGAFSLVLSKTHRRQVKLFIAVSSCASCLQAQLARRHL